MTVVEPYKTCISHIENISCFPSITNFRPFFLIFLTSLDIKNTKSSIEDLHFLGDLSLIIKTCRNLPSNAF